MLETGVLISKDSKILCWHLPPGRNAGALPDSVDLWTAMWDNRDNIHGFAHSHPGGGIPGPSFEDVTTFSAVERALGKRIDWWIISRDHLIILRWVGPGKLMYGAELLNEKPFWLDELRRLSYGS